MKMLPHALCLLFVFPILAFGQKGNIYIGLNLGTTITLTESSYYKPGLHFGAVGVYGISKKNNDAITLNAGFHTFTNKRITSDVIKMADIKGGFRFFPSAKVPIYLHPNLGVGFFVDGSGGKLNAAASITLGYLPKIGPGNLNIFATYDRITFSPGISLLNLGLGYQLRFKGKEKK